MRKITYRTVGDVKLPNLMLAEKEVELNIYGRARQRYLMEEHETDYYGMLTKGTLSDHLEDIQTRAKETEERLVKEMMEREGLTEEVKSNDMIRWVQGVNNIRNRAREVVMNELIYTL